MERPPEGGLHRHRQLRHPVPAGHGREDEGRPAGGLLPDRETLFLLGSVTGAELLSLRFFFFFVSSQDFMFFEKVGEANQRSSVFS